MLRRAVLAPTMTLVAALASTIPAGAADYRYVEPGSSHEFAVLTAPLPAETIGAGVIAAVDDVRRRLAGEEDAVEAAAAASPAPPVPSGPPSIASWGTPAAAPFGAVKPRARSCNCSTAVGDVTRERIAALYLRREFHVGPEREKLRVLKLRARYEDALVAWINGVEVARRNLDPTASPAAPARRPHGPEWESFYLQVPPGLLVDGANELVVEVRPIASRLAPTVDLELVGAEQARIVRGPIVQRVGETRATIVFETDIPTIGELVYGTEPSKYEGKMTSASRTEPSTRHVFELTGLPADARIHYQVATPEDRTADQEFHTAAAPGEPVRFVVYGDVRSGHDTHADILNAITAEAPDYVISTGDLVLRGSDEADWQRFFAIAAPLLARFPLYPAIGNHDMGKAGYIERRFEDIFELWPAPKTRPAGAAWYSFDVGDVHWIMLDSNMYDDARQLDWLELDLQRAREAGARAIFAAVHHGPWSRGPHGGAKIAVEKYVPLMEKYGVSMVFSGHDHLYQRGKVGDLAYVVTGGGGAPLYKPSCKKKGRKACSEDGAAISVAEHHFVVVEVFDDHGRLCPRRKDGTLLEACVDFELE